MDAVLLTNGVLCLLVAALPPTVWGQQATSIVELRESAERTGTDHTGDIVSFTDLGSGASGTSPPWVCFTEPNNIDPTNVEWQTPDNTTISTGASPAADDSVVTRAISGATPGVFLYRGTNYFSPDGDYCCVLTINGTESERRCVTFTPCPTLDPPTYTNGSITYNPDTNVATYGCVTGYIATFITSGDQQRTCVSDGTSVGNWTGSAPTVTCTMIICPDLSLTNGMVTYSDVTLPRDEGSTATYMCNDGYNRSGNTVRTCTASGWDGTEPMCNPVNCQSLTDPTNGMVDTSSGTTFMNIATYSCDDGYTVMGDMYRTCQSNGHWNGNPPTCDLSPPMITTQPQNTIGAEFTGCPSGPDIDWNIQWPITDPDTTATQPCPGELSSVTGEATRYCDVNGEWSVPSVLNCQQREFEEISAQIQALTNDTEVLIERTVNLTKQLAVITEPTSMSLLPSSLNTTNTLISTVLDVLETRGNNTATDANEFIIDVLDNILDENNTQGWTGLQQTGAGSQVLLKNTERFAELLATSQNNSDSGGPVRISRPNIAVSAMLINSSAPTGHKLQFPQEEDLLNFTNSSTVPAEIEIPTELLTERLSQLNGGILPVTFTLLQNLGTFLPSSASGLTNSSSASIIISSQVGPRDSVGQSVELQDNPISINFTFSSVPNPNDSLCVFWNFSNPVGNGGWVSEGVRTVESTTDCGEQVTTVQCTSTHLTSFAVLVDVAGGLKDVCAGERLALQVVSYIGCAVSILCLLVTVIFFITHGKKLLASVHYFVHLNLALSLLLGYVVFVFGLETAVGSKGGCVFVAVLLHYFFLSAFCWMLCEGVMLYLLLVVVFSQVIKKWSFFLLIGYVTPIPFVVITLAVRSDYYGVRDELTGELQFCWLSTKEGTIFGFVVPMLLIILINVTFLVLALRVIWSSQSKSISRVHNKASESEKNLRVAKSVLFSSLVLLPLLGLTWIFGLLTIDSNTTVFAWIFTILNSLQGVAIFFFHVLRNDKVKAKLGPFCFTFKKITKRYKLFEPTSSTACDASKYQFTEQGLGTLKSSVDIDVRIKEDLVSHQVSCELSETKVDLASESAIKYDKLITESETTPPTDEITTIEHFVSKSMKQDGDQNVDV